MPFPPSVDGIHRFAAHRRQDRLYWPELRGGRQRESAPCTRRCDARIVQTNVELCRTRVQSVDSWGSVLLFSAGAGAVLTVAYLRIRSRRSRVLLVGRLANGEIVWGAQVRQVVDHRWGVSGLLVANPDARLVLEPDTASVKRGARVMEWPLSGCSLGIGPRKWDITGVRYRFVTVRPGSGESELRFAAAQIVGVMPHQASGWRP